jgi:hypothetical protein
VKKFYYYAELNDQDVCVRIVSDTTKKVGSTRHIEIHEYNPTVVYKKWLGDQWSAESYEPSVDTVLQDKVDAFEVIVDNMKLENVGLTNQVTTLNSSISQLEGTIMELTAMLATLQGGK